MTNGDRVRTFSNEQLALTIMCPNDAVLDDIECRKNESDKHFCARCVYDWLNAEETNWDEQGGMGEMGLPCTANMDMLRRRGRKFDEMHKGYMPAIPLN